MTERDCNTCAHHKQTLVDHPMCGDCLRSSNLFYWEPIVIHECSTCKFSEVDEFAQPCRSCFPDEPAWEPKLTASQTGLIGKSKPENDGSTADYYVLPEGATQLQDLISYRNMNAQMGEIFRATFRYGQGHHSPKERDLKKIIFYAQQELERIKKYES